MICDRDPCPCGSREPFIDCCKAVIDHDSATTPEALMRSRYSAFVVGAWDYLLQSWHPDTRPSRISSRNSAWLGLTIVDSNEDQVEFIAAFRDGRDICALHEISRFAQIDGHWRYLDGKCEVTVAKRNSPCPCGSGKKTKRCCGRPGRNI